MLIENLLFHLGLYFLLAITAIVASFFYFPIPFQFSKWADHIWGCYAGVISLVLMNLPVSFDESATLDLRYVPFILSVFYLGAAPGALAGLFLFVEQLFFSTTVWLDSMIFAIAFPLFIASSLVVKRRYPRLAALFVAYLFSYFIVRWMNGAQDSFSFAMTKTTFTLAGVAVGGWLMGAYQSLYGMMNRLTVLYRSLKESQEELKDTIRGQQGLIFKFIKSESGFRITLCDGMLIRRSQLNPEMFLSPDWMKFFVPKESVASTLYHFNKAWLGEETAYEWPGLNDRYYFVLLRPIFRSGRVVEVVGSAIDITEKRRMERALEESQRHYRLIAENTTDLIAVIEANGKIKYLSPSHENVLGYCADELLDGEICAIFEPQVLYRIREKLDKIILNKKPEHFEYECRRKDGSLARFEARCMPVFDARGGVECVVAVSRDISERKKAEEIALASEKLALAGKLAAGVAHEIRNPLTTLKGFIQLFKKGEMNPVYLDLIHAELEQIEQITNEFLILAKPQGERFRYESIVVILENVISLLTPQMNLNNIQAHTRFQRDIPMIYGEANRLKQMFVNIFKNAIEAMPNGGTIEVRVFAEGDFLTVEVEDSGCGIDPDLIPRLGEPFYTLKEKGTGLGLMVCKKIIKEHRGTMRFRSELNKGATVQITLPLQRRTKKEERSERRHAYLG